MMRFGSIWKARVGAPQADPAALARIREWTRAALALGSDVTISANEIICGDPACPGSETVILVMIPGQRTRAYKVQAAAADVTEPMVAAALA